MSGQFQREIVIIGGGIIGCTTAYYITRHPSYDRSTKITILEASANGVAQGASGKAGGLVAIWAYPKELVEVSFREHVKLAEEHDGANRWGWRYVNCGSWEGRGELPSGVDDLETGVGKGGSRKSLEKTLGLDLDNAQKQARSSKNRLAKGLPDDLLWAREDLAEHYAAMAPAGATAQVHPYLFTASMLELAMSNNVSLIKGCVKSITKADGRVTGVEYVDAGARSAKHITATHIVLAAGPWSSRLVPEIPLTASRAHSITIRPKTGVTIAPYVLFTEITLSIGRKGKPITASPEIYARPDNEVYACGPGDDSPLPDNVDNVAVDQTACDSIAQQVSSISNELREGTVERRQACFLPIVGLGSGPIVGEADHTAKGLIIATGHTCWGICNAPGTARAVSELLMDGKISCGNLAKLKPSLHF
ncbi:hypothetical protein AX15_000328 [Amanita polypyramis BW_CC]|nr:hypothetical protein AX15_000328 [Amanita polypyramis BW_CC]